jgi:hypothetical protein
VQKEQRGHYPLSSYDSLITIQGLEAARGTAYEFIAKWGLQDIAQVDMTEDNASNESQLSSFQSSP